MRIEVHIKDKQFTINCGDGLQKLKWLGDVAIFRFDQFYSTNTGTTKGIRYENGTMLNMNEIIKDVLTDQSHVWVVLKEDLEALGIDNQRSIVANNSFNPRPMTGIRK